MSEGYGPVLISKKYASLEELKGEVLARTLSAGLKQSIHYGYTHQSEAIPYALQYGRGIDIALGAERNLIALLWAL